MNYENRVESPSYHLANKGNLSDLENSKENNQIY